MAQAKENTGSPSPSARRNNPGSEGRAQRPRRPMYNRRPRRPQNAGKGGSNVPIHIYPLGGLGEVGKNMTVYECCGDMIIVDCGLVFPDSEMYGVDMVIPDFTFVIQNKDKIKGLLITHGHEDHIGSIPYLLQKVDLPVYGTKLTLGLIRNKLEEFNLAGRTHFVEITPKQKLHLGCFTVEPIHVNHSIPDAVGFAIDSPAGVIIQTGDFKIDYTPLACGPTDLTTLAEYGRRGVLALLSDSTNAERPGFTATEQKVAAGVHNLFTQARNKRIIIATFASCHGPGAGLYAHPRGDPHQHRGSEPLCPRGSGADHHRQPGRAPERSVPDGFLQPPPGAGGPGRFHHHLGQPHPGQ